ncbi:hypothetical protein PTTG_04031 [Puccinia triticina 1-1 BBBD Race 1]|uniref:TAFII55_N domain-containing protein n=1 Tax=Puccinia triticina (isolate 1-1 / race 1 (BBBD)) TaxID=630390 RepID=A0A180GV57_PUCT1|nr:hypothetical protein PTTG_04031 [Puccinia triticina 1-1 BBBD Race 1]
MSSSKTSTKLRLKVPSNQDKNQQNNSPNNPNDDQNLGIANYLQGYDRELDSDQDEPIGFEEQFILKLPDSLSNESNKLRELVESRKEINSDQQNIFFKFKDSRRGLFNIGDKMFAMKLVDLPCIIESQKTFDNKHMLKIADICQMILVEDTPITNESTVTQGNFNIQDCIYPHGLTPPLHHVRKRRFRKRLNKRTIETVERAVERLLEEDGRADQVIIDIVDNVRDLSDSEGEDYQPPQSATVGFGNQPPSKIVYNKARPSISHTKRSSSQPFDPHGHHHQQQRHDERAKDSRSRQQHPQDLDPDGSAQTITVETPMGESLGAPTPAGEEFEDRGAMDYDDEGSIDSDLAAEIEAGLMESAAAEARAAAGLTGPEDEEDENDSEDLFGDGDNDDDEEDDDDEEEDDDDDEEETNEMVEDKQRIRLLQGELKDLEAAVSRKKVETAGATNLIVRKRFEEALKKLNLELESKKNQLTSTQTSLQNAISLRKLQKDSAKNQLLQQQQQTTTITSETNGGPDQSLPQSSSDATLHQSDFDTLQLNDQQQRGDPDQTTPSS